MIKKLSQNCPIQNYNSDNFIRKRLSDRKKITFAIKYPLMSHLR